jgi:KipI family sensor histidine kinase inhibitor
VSFDVFRVSHSALLFRFGDRIAVGLSRRIASLSEQLRFYGIHDVVPSYTTLLVLFDPATIDARTIEGAAGDAWRAGSEQQRASHERPPIEIPVVYGGTHGPDLGDVARRARISPDEVIRLHSEAEYVVGAVGFSPGFGYLIGLPDELATPRRQTPRIRVPAGSVAIGGAQTGVYPVETAGGWNLIGRTPVAMFDPWRDDPFLLRTGDIVRFRPVGRSSFPVTTRPKPPGRIHRGVEIIEPGLLTTIQDLGRVGFGAYGIAPNGAADRSALVLANRLVGNAVDAAGLEITMTGPTLRFHQATAVAITGEGPHPRLNGRLIERNRAHRVHLLDEITFDPITSEAGARAYLSVAGGFDVPEVMGSRSTDLVAGIGGLNGRALQRKDRVAIGKMTGYPQVIHMPPGRSRGVLRVLPGPQRAMFDAATWQRLLDREFTVSNDANRVGVRLEGPLLLPCDQADMISEGVVTGSIQVTASGQPIVLLPGRATIGGYPKIATVIDDDLDLLGQLRPGDPVRFRDAAR